MALTAEQVAERTSYLGGSDIPGVLGLSKWRSPLSIWAEKTGAVEPEDISNKIQVRFGNKMEAVLAELFEEDTGKKLHRVNQEIVHPAYSFLRGHVDRRVVSENAVVEIKTTSAWRSREFEDGNMPAEWIIQTMYYMALGGYDRGYVAYSLGNQEFTIRTIERDPVAFAEIIRKAANFWTQFVEPKIMPTMITKHDADVLFKLFPNGDEAEPMALGDEANRLAESIKALQQDQIHLEGIIEKEKNALRAMLKDKAVGLTDRFKVTWKNQITNRLDTERLKAEESQIYSQFLKPVSSRVLRITEIKQKQPTKENGGQ